MLFLLTPKQHLLLSLSRSLLSLFLPLSLSLFALSLTRLLARSLALFYPSALPFQATDRVARGSGHGPSIWQLCFRSGSLRRAREKRERERGRKGRAKADFSELGPIHEHPHTHTYIERSHSGPVSWLSVCGPHNSHINVHICSLDTDNQPTKV